MVARVVEVVDGHADRAAAGHLEGCREVVGEPGLPGPVGSVDDHEQRPVGVGQTRDDAGEDGAALGSHSSKPRTCSPACRWARTMKSQTSP